MLGDDNNIKDSNLSLSPSIKDSPLSITYSKSDKLITALYMVTDVMDVSEPLRNKLRTLGTEILLDIHSAPQKTLSKISAIISLLDISRAMRLISEMNASILKKEFLRLQESVNEYGKIRSVWFEDYSQDTNNEVAHTEAPKNNFIKDTRTTFIGHIQASKVSHPTTRIGVQKGSTLMKALSDKTADISKGLSQPSNNFDVLKKQRRETIIATIRKSSDGLTITDIRTKAKELPSKGEVLMSCSEKTLQRELISMLKDNVLYKTGEKRWSKYFVKS